MPKKIRIPLLAGLVVALSLFLACGGDGGEQTSAPDEVKYWLWNESTKATLKSEPLPMFVDPLEEVVVDSNTILLYGFYKKGALHFLIPLDANIQVVYDFFQEQVHVSPLDTNGVSSCLDDYVLQVNQWHYSVPPTSGIPIADDVVFFACNEKLAKKLEAAIQIAKNEDINPTDRSLFSPIEVSRRYPDLDKHPR